MFRLKKTFFLTSAVLLLPLFVLAQDSKEETITAFRQVREVTAPAIAVPTVLELNFSDSLLERNQFAVEDTTSGELQPYLFKTETSATDAALSTNSTASNNSYMTDEDKETYAEFLLPENGLGQESIVVSAASPVQSSALTLLLAKNVALPKTIEIRAQVNGQEQVVLALAEMTSQTVRFPTTASSQWTINLTYSQPLRIADINFHQESKATKKKVLRWLSQPEAGYRVYFDPDRYVAAPKGEAGNLSKDEDVLAVTAINSGENASYKIADVDEDGIPDISDNCVSISNADQEDLNQNGQGDVCEDFDKDGVLNPKDNCPNNPNKSQADEDGDGQGDACDDEESRFTEANPWVPWVGIIAAIVVVVTLLAITVMSLRKEKDKTEDEVQAEEETEEAPPAGGVPPEAGKTE